MQLNIIIPVIKYGALAVERRIVDREAISFTPLCLCLSEERLEVVGPYCLVSMPGEIKRCTP